MHKSIYVLPVYLNGKLFNFLRVMICLIMNLIHTDSTVKAAERACGLESAEE